MFKKRISKNSPYEKNTVFDIHPRNSSGWNQPKEMVSLRRHLYRRHPILTSVGALAMVLVVVLTADTFLGHANTVYWYPGSCLGGWTNPANAAGAPELSPLAVADEFTADNSAILDNSISQIFCGEFGGDIPEGSVPVAAVLNISWVFKTAPEPGGVAQSDPLEPVEVVPGDEAGQASSTPDIISPSDEVPIDPTPSSSDPAAVPEPEPEPIPPVLPEPAPAEPAPAPAEDSGPAVQLFPFVQLAFAQETTTTPEVIVPEATTSEIAIPEAVIDDVASSSTDEIINTSSTTEAPPIDEAPPVDEVVPVDDAPLEERNILTIRYSMDGGPWLILGIIGESSWQAAQFDIPFTSWEDLNSLQISFTSISVSDIAPVVYLDGISLAVDYEPVDSDAEELSEEPEEYIEAINMPVQPLKVRNFTKTIQVDEDASHECDAVPFSIDISGKQRASGKITLEKSADTSYEIEIGSLPNGIDMTFLNNNSYLYIPSSGEASLDIEIVSEAGSQKGDFTVPIIYTQKGVKDSSIVCQINIVNL